MITQLPTQAYAEAVLLDSNEMFNGYWDAHEGDPKPGDNRSYSYLHGWRNGAANRAHDAVP